MSAFDLFSVLDNKMDNKRCISHRADNQRLDPD